MSTHFVGEGNIGSAPQFRVFPNGNEEPRQMMRLNVRFDNPVPVKGGGYEDRGGFWAPVEIWHRDTEHWSKNLYQRGMRVLVEGRMVTNEWQDQEGMTRVVMKVEARRIGILPHRVASVALAEKQSTDPEHEQSEPPDFGDEADGQKNTQNKGSKKAAENKSSKKPG